MYYNDSQWTDTEGLLDDAGGGTGYLVPNTALKDYNILGTPDSADEVTGEIIEGEDPMTEAEVQAIATQTGFAITDYSF